MSVAAAVNVLAIDAEFITGEGRTIASWRLSTRVEVWALCRDRRPLIQLGRTACRSPVDARSHRRDDDQRSAPPIGGL